MSKSGLWTASAGQCWRGSAGTTGLDCSRQAETENSVHILPHAGVSVKRRYMGSRSGYSEVVTAAAEAYELTTQGGTTEFARVVAA
jgi:hypothetical protein